MTYKIYNSFDDAKEVWQNMSKYSHYYFTSFLWLDTWYEQFSKFKKVEKLILLYASNGSDEIFIPMCLQMEKGVRLLKYLGDELSDYHSPIFNCSESFAQDVFKFIINKNFPYKYDALYFEKQPEYIYERINPFHKFGTLLSSDISHQLNITSNFQVIYEGHVRTKTRSDIRRQIKRLSDFGKIDFKIAISDQEKNSFLKAMMIQKEARYISSGTKNIFKYDEYKKFYEQLTLTDPNIHLSALTLNGNIIATHWGIMHDTHFYLLMPTYNVEWHTYSTGKIHLKHLVETVCNQGGTLFDFTIGDESYKSEWCDKTILLSTRYKIHTIKGALYILIKKIEFFLKLSPQIHSFMRQLKRFLERFIRV